MIFIRNMHIPTLRTGGFSLVEAIVSITIMVFAISGPLALSAQSLRASREARAEIEATHLAEEGIEMIRNIRDNNSAQDTSANKNAWLDNIIVECSVNPCIIDVSDHSGGGVWGSSTLRGCDATCLSSDEIYLYKNTNTGFYVQKSLSFGPSWVKTNYTRLVKVDVIDAATKVRVTSTVTYKGFNGGARTMVTSEELYNWFPCLLNGCPL